MNFKFTRHAKNRMRLYGITKDEVKHIILAPEFTTPSIEGRANAVKALRGMSVLVTYIVEAGTTVVITVIELR